MKRKWIVWGIVMGVLAAVATALILTMLNRTDSGNEIIEEEAVDLVAPVIEGEDVVTVYKNDLLEIVSQYKVSDDSGEEVQVRTEGECDTTVLGTCAIKIIAVDKSGNEASREVIVNVVADPEVEALGESEYFIRVNREHNVVMVYALGRDGEYGNLVKTFVASTGREGWETPLGTFMVSDRYEALFLVGNVWGHYAVRIDGPFFFHSVPYFTKGDPEWDDLEYLEYNKLGDVGSAGCVRLAARDAKWIYDNVEMGTTVEIYDGELPEGVVKPEPIRIDVEDGRRGWDPTDSDEANPWNML